MPEPLGYARGEALMTDSRPPRIPRVLFVEGDELVARAVARSLRKAAELAVAGGAAAARKALGERPFDVVISDLWLPDGDGLALLIEAARLCPGAKLVLYSGVGPTPGTELALCEGRISALLCKPEGLAGLFALVRGWVPAG
jgi:DNA-binding NtrC family response regulator